MNLSSASAVLLMSGVLSVWAQDQPPPSPAPAAPQPVILEYTGKPVVLPFRCTDEDINLSGLSCSEEEPCPVYLELSTVEYAGARIFAAGNLHSAAVTLYSVLLGSDDGGRTWRELQDRIRGAGLDHIQFFDADNGWVTGVMLSPLPQDPFLLLTSDGGKTWKREDIFGEGAENHFGAIQQFYFSGKTGGSLVIDRGAGSGSGRYVLFESPNSGETWMIKEESGKPLKLKRPPAVVLEWRIRADGATQSFRVERRQGERWSTAAAFAVKVGPCKPPGIIAPAPR